MEVNSVNPLLIPLVIKEVYKYLYFYDKKSFRLVCKAWIDTILELWRKQTWLRIGLVEHKSNGRVNRRPQTADSILEYFNLYGIAEKPLLNLKLFNLEFSFLPDDFLQKAQSDRNIARISVIQSVQNLLATHFGHSLKRLELVGCTFLQQGNPKAGFYHILLKDFPNLEVFSVRQPKVIASFGHKLILNETSFPRAQSDLITLNLAVEVEGLKQDTFTRIVNLLPKLKNLSLRGAACDAFQALLSPLSSSGSHILLERLGIDIASPNDTHKLFKIPTWIKNYLEAARPPLKCLKASLPFGMFPPRVRFVQFPGEPFIYKSVWNCVGNTLTSINLRIWTGLWNWCTLFTGYSLPNLTHLCLNFRELNTEEETHNVDLLHFDFGMLRGTPLLKKLHLNFEIMLAIRTRQVGTNLEENQLEWRGNAGSELPGPIVLEHMEDFRFDLYHKPTEGCWRAFAEMMPNLRKLQGIVDEDMKPLVRQLWPELKLEWSTLQRRIYQWSQMDDLEEGTIPVEMEWLEVDWENWNGKVDYIDSTI